MVRVDLGLLQAQVLREAILGDRLLRRKAAHSNRLALGAVGAKQVS